MLRSRHLTLVAVLVAALAAPAHALAAGTPANQVIAAHEQARLAQEPAPDVPTLGFTDMVGRADAHQLRSVLIDQVDGRLLITTSTGEQRLVLVPQPDATLAQLLARDGVQVSFGAVTATGHAAGGGGVPIALLLVMGMMVLCVISFAVLQQRRYGRTARAKRSEPKPTPVVTTRFSDVAGCDEAVEELRDTLDFLRHPERYQRLGATMPSGIMLYGPPGTGKTLLAKAVAGEAGIPFYAASASDFVELYVGTGAKRVRELFAKARKSEEGAVVFIDEIDAVGRKRQSGPGSSNQEAENTLNALLVELDGFAERSKIICIAATNRLDMLDSALLRPGRFGLQVAVETPDEAGRRQILELYAHNKPLADDIDLDALAAYTAGSTGAQLADMLNQAAIMAARSGRSEIVDADLREGHLRVLAGPERQNAAVREDERRLVAWHEAGHTLAAELSETQDKTQRVTIRPRGRAAGLAVYGQTDRALHNRQFFHERLICILAGRASEQLLVNEVSSGAANDLQQANQIARQAVLELGFSERVGQLISHSGSHHLSDGTRRVADEEVERMVADAYRDALSLLAAHRLKLDSLAEALLERGQLERVDILVAIGGEPEQVASRPRRPKLHLVTEERPAPSPATGRGEGRLVAVARYVEQRPWRRKRGLAS